jgi:hypothetical protein
MLNLNRIHVVALVVVPTFFGCATFAPSVPPLRSELSMSSELEALSQDLWETDPFHKRIPGAHFSGLLGARSFEDPNWGAFSNPIQAGVVYDQSSLRGWANLDVGLYVSNETVTVNLPPVTRIDTSTVEATLGIVKWVPVGNSPLEFYVGGGGSMLYVESELEIAGGLRDTDAIFGAYARGGLVFHMENSGQYIGIDVRYMNGPNLRLAGSQLSSESTAVHLILGSAF